MTPPLNPVVEARQAAIKAGQGAYLADDSRREIRICAGTACHASGRVALRKAVDAALAERRLTAKVAVIETGCHGFCEQGPIMVLRPHGVFYPRVQPKDVAEIILASVVGDGIVERLLSHRLRVAGVHHGGRADAR